MPKKYYCQTCRRTLDGTQFYTSNNLEKFPNDGKLLECKKCRTLLVDNWDPKTYLPILEEIDVPYVQDQWNKLLASYGEKNPEKLTGTSILGRYLATMRLKQWRDYRWADTDKIAAELEQQKRGILHASGFSDEEIEEEIARSKEAPIPPPEVLEPQEEAGVDSDESPSDQETPAKRKKKKSKEAEEDAAAESNAPNFFAPVLTIEEEIADLDLTEEDVTYLKLKWGVGYRPSEWVKMEQLYEDMMASYDIQTAGHKDTLVMLCKTSLKANQFLDQGDIDAFQKMSRAYDTLMKSGKFTAAQNKAEQGEFLDSIGEFVMICERDGYIPKSYVESPRDKVDRVIEDNQRYTYNLVTEEMGLGNLIENAIKQMEEEKQNILRAGDDAGDEDEEYAEEERLFDYETNDFETLSSQDFQDFYSLEEEDIVEDQGYLESLATANTEGSGD